MFSYFLITDELLITNQLWITYQLVLMEKLKPLKLSYADGLYRTCTYYKWIIQVYLLNSLPDKVPSIARNDS